MARAVSPLFTTVIMTAAILAISLIIAYNAMITLQYSVADTEFGYVATTFQTIANSMPSIIQGNAFVARVPMKMVGIGYYSVNNELGINVYINNSPTPNDTIVIDNKPYALVGTVRAGLISHWEKLFGGCRSLVVDSLLNITCVCRYFNNGASIVELNTTRIYMRSITSSDSIDIYIEYINLTPVAQGSSGLIQMGLADKNTIIKTYNNVNSVSIELYYGDKTEIIHSTGVLPVPITVNIIIVIYTVSVVIT